MIVQRSENLIYAGSLITLAIPYYTVRKSQMPKKQIRKHVSHANRGRPADAPDGSLNNGPSSGQPQGPSAIPTDQSLNVGVAGMGIHSGASIR